MEISNDVRVTRFVPPTIRRGKPRLADNQKAAVPPVKSDNPPAVKDTSGMAVNPLAALFDRGHGSTPSMRGAGKPADDQPIRGRFLDVLA